MLDYNALVDEWFMETIHGTVVGRYTDAYNVVLAAKDDLKKRLAASTAAPAVTTEHEKE